MTNKALLCLILSMTVLFSMLSPSEAKTSEKQKVTKPTPTIIIGDEDEVLPWPWLESRCLASYSSLSGNWYLQKENEIFNLDFSIRRKNRTVNTTTLGVFSEHYANGYKTTQKSETHIQRPNPYMLILKLPTQKNQENPFGALFRDHSANNELISLEIVPEKGLSCRDKRFLIIIKRWKLPRNLLSIHKPEGSMQTIQYEQWVFRKGQATE